jgi:hypothetical protein
MLFLSTLLPQFFLLYPVFLALGDCACTNPLVVIDNGVLKPLAIESNADASLQWRCSVVLTAVTSQQVGVPPAMECWRFQHNPYSKMGGEQILSCSLCASSAGLCFVSILGAAVWNDYESHRYIWSVWQQTLTCFTHLSWRTARFSVKTWKTNFCDSLSVIRGEELASVCVKAQRNMLLCSCWRWTVLVFIFKTKRAILL